ncbi:hypothetical protein L484_023608 [Morus notabilis]|uniref:RNase H type-1 domain-containing protein n=1 Tax=Morus notabilis TaxID=981085 RepID=W9S5J0_9ROSA|nr:hypothetical protein L484_023608 [Morus notabilis]
MAASKRIEGRFSPYVAECLAIREGIYFALKRGFHNWVLESDANNVIRMIQLRGYSFVFLRQVI